MSRRLTPVSHSDLVRRLRRLGWEGPIRRSKHFHMVRPGREYPLIIPNPHTGQELVLLCFGESCAKPESHAKSGWGDEEIDSSGLGTPIALCPAA